MTINLLRKKSLLVWFALFLMVSYLSACGSTGTTNGSLTTETLEGTDTIDDADATIATNPRKTHVVYAESNESGELVFVDFNGNETSCSAVDGKYECTLEEACYEVALEKEGKRFPMVFDEKQPFTSLFVPVSAIEDKNLGIFDIKGNNLILENVDAVTKDIDFESADIDFNGSIDSCESETPLSSPEGCYLSWVTAGERPLTSGGITILQMSSSLPIAKSEISLEGAEIWNADGSVVEGVTMEINTSTIKPKLLSIFVKGIGEDSYEAYFPANTLKCQIKTGEILPIKTDTTFSFKTVSASNEGRL